MTAIDDFEALCAPATSAQLARLTLRLPTHVDVVAEAALTEPALAVELAGELAKRLAALADSSPGLSGEQRAWVHGAIMYFLLTGDADNDLAGPHGLGDDRVVFDEVCRRLGREDFVIGD